jgi:DNA-binding LytR/AlgR family response regulator
VQAIRDLDPDLVFLDVKMPGLDGFAVIDEIGADKMPPVIFLTAHEEHALRAFRVNALDYLLKPIDTGDLRKSVERARRRRAQDELGDWLASCARSSAAFAHDVRAPTPPSASSCAPTAACTCSIHKDRLGRSSRRIT